MTTAEIAQRTAASVGYSGVPVVAGMSLTDINLIVQISVGVITFISIAIHLVLRIRAERRLRNEKTD